MYEYDKTEESSVTCRIGSLETAGGRKNYIRDGYLPNRQLRNVRCRITPPAKSYLPNRQLRKHCYLNHGLFPRYLPNRQLRNEQWTHNNHAPSYLPNRQLRKMMSSR